ncbi:MAG: hypothetical protein ACFCUR_09420 [Rhodomicrobiaceae bacterium]
MNNGIANPGLWIAGALLLLAGIIIRRIVARYDFRGMLTSSVWQVARGRRTAEHKTEIEDRFNEIASAGTHSGKARRLTGNVVGHFVAPVMGLIGLAAFLPGPASGPQPFS